MTKQIIAVDADDTIFDENTAVRLFMNDTYGFTHTAEDYLMEGPFMGYWEHIWNTTPEETNDMYEKFVVSTYKHNLEPIEGALRVLQKLKKSYDLVVVTARDHRGVSMTHESLALHYPDIFSDVHFVPLWGSSKKATKAMICNEIGASYLVDDSPKHCELAVAAGVQAILFGSYGWNRFQDVPSGVTRCKTWDDVLSILI